MFSKKWDCDTKGRHTFNVKPVRKFWASSHQSSRQREVVLARLRLGHTNLTHRHLISTDLSAPECEICRVPLTVRHLLLDCRKVQTQRMPLIFYTGSRQIPLSLSTVLGNEHPTLLRLLFRFLDQTKLTSQI